MELNLYNSECEEKKNTPADSWSRSIAKLSMLIKVGLKWQEAVEIYQNMQITQ